MTIDELTAFLGWGIVINAGFMLLWLVFFKFAPDLTYRTQRTLIDISQQEFEQLMYRMMGYFKLGIILFYFTPYLALRIMI